MNNGYIVILYLLSWCYKNYIICGFYFKEYVGNIGNFNVVNLGIVNVSVRFFNKINSWFIIGC